MVAAIVAGKIVPIGRYIFANYGQADYTNPLGLLLRFDIDTGAVQAFGIPDLSTNKTYYSLSAGPDGLLYAMANSFGFNNTVPGAPVDIYDPNTLKLVRTIYLNLGTADFPVINIGKIAVGPAGEFYALPDDFYRTNSIYKLDANGQKVATLVFTLSTDELSNGGVDFDSVRVDAKGNIVVGALEPIFIDPSFQTMTPLNVYGTSLPDYRTAVTATFIGP